MRLADRYDQLHRASTEAEADARFLALAGLGHGPPPGNHAPTPRAALLRYGTPRRIDLVALRRGARDITKFEDLPAPIAAALAQRLAREGFTTRTVGPYARRFDVVLSVTGPGDRYTVVASRGPGAHALVEAETDRSEVGTRRAGTLLGYPPCCIEAFIATARTAEAETEGVNEACLRALCDTGPIHWSLHPLATLSLVAFAPCHGRCMRAMSFARKVFDAVMAEDSSAAEVLRATLGTPLLLLRVSAFWALVGGAPTSAWVRFTRAVLHDDGEVPWLTGRAARCVGTHLAASDGVRLDDRTLTLTHGETVTAQWPLDDARVPRVIVFAQT